MPSFEIRPFRKQDREQVTDLVNGHAAAVVPGAAASVNAVLSQFEAEPGEFVVDPWVAQRLPLVAVRAARVVAAALLLRYRDEPDVGEALRGAGDLRWILFNPLAPAGNPYWTDGTAAAGALMSACLTQCRAWGVRAVLADGALPVPGVYGIPDQWPHVADLLSANGFRHVGGVEVVHLADLADVPVPDAATVPGLDGPVRSVGINGTRLTVDAGGRRAGFVEVARLDLPPHQGGPAGIADVGNLWVADDGEDGPGPRDRSVVAAHLLRCAAAWLRLGGARTLMHYSGPEDTDDHALVAANGFVEITRTRRGWRLT